MLLSHLAIEKAVSKCSSKKNKKANTQEVAMADTLTVDAENKEAK